MSKHIHRPGEIVPKSGQYAVVKSNGAYAGREVTCVKDERFPPTRVGEYGFVMKDPTVHSR